MSNKAFLALGSNIGDREDKLKQAVGLISGMTGTRLTGTSNIYETNPVGYTDQDRFLNMVVAVETELKPMELLEGIHRIEGVLGRTREIHWGPRTIDIDILLYDDEVIDLPELTIPHPRMFERAFVLVPLKDVFNEGRILGKNITELIEKCSDRKGIRLYRPAGNKE